MQMYDAEPPLEPAGSRLLDRLQAVIEVLLLSGLVSSFFAVFPFSWLLKQSPAALNDSRVLTGFLLLEASITFLLLFVVLKLNRQTLKDFGWSTHRWAAQVIVGAVVVPVLFLIGSGISEGFRIVLPGYYLDKNPLTDMIRAPQDLALFLIAAVVAGGIKEELQRAFILTRFREHLGGARLGLLLWSVAFGLGHYLQGVQGVVTATLFGLLFGVVYLARRNLIAPMVAHGLYDVAAILGYWFFQS